MSTRDNLLPSGKFQDLISLLQKNQKAILASPKTGESKSSDKKKTDEKSKPQEKATKDEKPKAEDKPKEESTLAGLISNQSFGGTGPRSIQLGLKLTF